MVTVGPFIHTFIAHFKSTTYIYLSIYHHTAITSSVRLCVVAPTVNVHVADRKLKFKAGWEDVWMNYWMYSWLLNAYYCIVYELMCCWMVMFWWHHVIRSFLNLHQYTLYSSSLLINTTILINVAILIKTSILNITILIITTPSQTISDDVETVLVAWSAWPLQLPVQAEDWELFSWWWQPGVVATVPISSNAGIYRTTCAVRNGQFIHVIDSRWYMIDDRWLIVIGGCLSGCHL